MRKLIAMVAVAAGLMLGSVANAAQVDIFLEQTSATDWTLTVNNNGPIPVVAINAFVTGLNGIAYSNPNINPTFSSYTIEAAPGFNFLIVDATGSAGPLTANNTLGSLIVTLSVGDGTGPVGFEGAEVIGQQDTVFGPLGVAITDYSITVTPIPPVPEPTTMVLFGLGLAALGLVRRSA